MFLWEIPELSTLNRSFSGNIRNDQTFERCAVPYLYRFNLQHGKNVHFGDQFSLALSSTFWTRARTHSSCWSLFSNCGTGRWLRSQANHAINLVAYLRKPHQIQALVHVFGQTGFLVAYTIKSATHPSVIDRFTSVSFFPLLPYTPTTDLTPWLGKFSSTLITCQVSCFWQTIAHLPICWGNSVFLVVFWPCAFLSRTYWVGIWRSRMSKSSWNLWTLVSMFETKVPSAMGWIDSGSGTAWISFSQVSSVM